jgi:AraC-like DNA-binding protein
MKIVQYPIQNSALGDFIQQIGLFRFDLDLGKEASALPFPPQPVNCLYFYPLDRVTAFNCANQKKELLPASTIIGPQLSRVDLTMGRHMLVIIVMFKPGGMHRLLGIPMGELRSRSFDSELFFGKDIERVIDQLNQTLDFEEMLKIVHDFLRQKARKLKPSLPIDQVLQLFAQANHPMRVDQLAAKACVSVRQLERQVNERIGMPPKEYTRLVRFSRAWVLKEKNTQMSWARIAHTCHYADQMHMIRDFKEFAGVTPTVLESKMLDENLKLQGNTF